MDIKRTISVAVWLEKAEHVDLFFRNHLFADEFYIGTCTGAMREAAKNWQETLESKGKTFIWEDCASHYKWVALRSPLETKDFIYLAEQGQAPNAPLRFFLEMFKSDVMDCFDGYHSFASAVLDARTGDTRTAHLTDGSSFMARRSLPEPDIELKQLVFPQEFHRIENLSKSSASSINFFPLTSHWLPGDMGDLEVMGRQRGAIDFNSLWTILLEMLRSQYAFRG